jgi:hypothetical protein
MANIGRRAIGTLVMGLAGIVAVGGGTAQAVTPVSYDWTMRLNEGRVSDAVLSYGIEGTHNQPLAFVCEEGGNRIFATKVGGPMTLWLLRFEAGGKVATISGTSEATEIPEMPVFKSLELDAGNPVFDALAESGAMHLTAGSEQRDMVASVKGKQDIAKFLAFCRG